jgi:hypothetical protein
MVIDHLLEAQLTTPNDEALAYFYCDRNQANRQDPEQILRSFVLQLSTSRSGDGVQPCLVEVYQRKRHKGPANPDLGESDCVELLHKLVDIYPHTTIILDALDEAVEDRRAGLVKVLDSLVMTATKPVKVFISSRPVPDIKNRYERGSNIAIDATDNARDINVFVAQQLDLYDERPNRRGKLPRELRQEIISTLHEKSNGM